MKKYFFVAYGGGHIRIIELVARELLSRGERNFSVLALTSAYGTVKDRLPRDVLMRITDYAHLFDDVLDDVLTYGTKLLGANFMPGLGISKLESILYLGLCYWDLIERHGAEQAEARYAARARHAFLPIRVLERIIEHERPNIVIATSSPKSELAALQVARDKGIESLQILDLFGDLHPLPIANHIVVMNENVEATLRRRGVTSASYYHLGQPVFDETVRQAKSVNVAALRLRHHLEQPVLLLATQQLVRFGKDRAIGAAVPCEEIYKTIINSLYQVSERGKRFVVLLRKHPNESNWVSQALLAAFPGFVRDGSGLTLSESLALCDGCITHSSTVALESVLCQRQTFTFSHQWDDVYPVEEFTRPPFIFAESLPRLEEIVQERFLRSAPPSLEGFFRFGATAKIADLLRDLNVAAQPLAAASC